MNTTGKKGFVFSLDLVIAFLAMLLMLSLMLLHLQTTKEQEIAAIEKLSLQEKGIFLIDSMVKNRNEKNPLLGSALFDEEKHRVLQNQIDLSMLLKGGQMQGSEFFVSSISFRAAGRQETRILAQPGKNCIALDRLVLMEGKTGKVEVTICEK